MRKRRRRLDSGQEARRVCVILLRRWEDKTLYSCSDPHFTEQTTEQLRYKANYVSPAPCDGLFYGFYNSTFTTAEDTITVVFVFYIIIHYS